MPYTPKGYTDKDAIEKYMLIDIDDQFDDKVDEWICMAENVIDQETNRDFTPGDDGEDPTDKLFDGTLTNELLIPPALTIESVKLSPTDDALDPANYYLYPANSTIKTKIVMPYLRFPRGHQNIVVNAKWGAGEVPADIKHAATVLVAGIINNAWADKNSVSSMTVGRYTVAYKTVAQKNDLDAVQDIMDRNKRYVF